LILVSCYLNILYRPKLCFTKSVAEAEAALSLAIITIGPIYMIRSRQMWLIYAKRPKFCHFMVENDKIHSQSETFETCCYSCSTQNSALDRMYS